MDSARRTEILELEQRRQSALLHGRYMALKFSSGPFHLEEQKWVEAFCGAARECVAIRRELGSKEPYLLTETELTEWLANAKKAFEAWVSPVFQSAIARANYLLEGGFHDLRLSASLGIACVAGNSKQKPESSIVLNINNSTITGLNLGSVVGGMNTTLITLEQQGKEDLAKALKALSEAIAADERLGAERRGLLENLSILAEQGQAPAQERRIGIVKAAYKYIREAIAVGGSAAAIWQTFGPQIASFFGLHH